MANLNRITPDYIFESSWEVCNKVGGIYTVLSTRAKTLQDLFKDKIIFIGPDLGKETDNPDFTENKTLFREWRKYALEKEQLNIRAGHWNIPGKPAALLIDSRSGYERKNRLYYRMWEKFHVDSLAAYGDYDEACLFACTAGQVIESFYHYMKLENQKVIAHFNEWTTGMGLLYLTDVLPAVATVFTTHATSIGRSICGNNRPLYEYFNSYQGDQMARELNMEAKHSLEKQTASQAGCFTTVSELTAKECTQLLEKKPDIVTPNGFESHFVPQGKTGETKRKSARRALIRAAGQLTGETIREDAFLLAISGRYEYKNKGIDLFIEAMNRVKKAGPQRQIIAFILVPAWINGPRTDLQNRLRREEQPDFPLSTPYYTHQLYFPEQDKICDYLSRLDFLNHPGCNTKIIFVPSYLNGNDGIFNRPYYDLLAALDLTVFPSYYEPWGYTPLESIAFGVPTITTNRTGFGLWAQEEIAAGQDTAAGVEIITRTDGNYFEAAEKIKECILKQATGLKPEQLALNKKAAWTLSEKAAWPHFIEFYLDAYDIALRKKENNPGK